MIVNETANRIVLIPLRVCGALSVRANLNMRLFADLINYGASLNRICFHFVFYSVLVEYFNRV